ncbi:MAG: DUF2946 family protein [Paracoccaceae bacterium]
MRRLRLLAALFLALSLLFGSVVEAVARNQMEGATDQVICGTGGSFTLQIDATGKPLTQHPCTHCLAASAVALLTASATIVAPTINRAIEPAPVAIPAAPVIQIHRPSARAPPLAV